jgi:hypothetical protein
MNTPENFHGKKKRNCINEWRNITNDRWILKTVCGYSVELETKPHQLYVPSLIKFTSEENLKIKEELLRFMNLGIIEHAPLDSNPDEYISNIFFRLKKDQKIRIILNLKQFNQHMKKFHFKMETLQHAINAMHPGCWMGSVDLSEAYYSVPITKNDRKYFRSLSWYQISI